MNHQQHYCSNFSKEGFGHPSEGQCSGPGLQYSDPFLVHPCLNWNLFQKTTKGYSLMGFRNCTMPDLHNDWHCKSETCCQQDIWRPKGSVCETASYQERGDYKSMCTSRTQQQRSHFPHCRTTQCVSASCTSLQPSQNRMGQTEKVTCLLCS